MSAHSFVEVNEVFLLACRESYLPSVAALFTEQELVVGDDTFGYLAQVGQMRDRLQLLGYTAARAREELAKAVDEWHADNPNPTADALGVPIRDVAMILDELSTAVNSTEWAHFEEPEEVFARLDARTILRLALDQVADATLPVRLNLDDLQRYRLLTPSDPITEKARQERQHAVALDAPLVILTEGSTDSQLLAEGIGVTHPHLAQFVRFMDFSANVEGSAAALAKLVRSFVGAGIANRVLAIADNDTAAYDALQKIKSEGLPDSYRLLHYPDLPLLKAYPTLGPQQDTPVIMDVNQKAGALEMYLGRELLEVGGGLVPVQWTGYVEGQKRYQGTLAKQHKSRIQADFSNKVKLARSNPAARAAQDWTGITAIIDAILAAFD